MEAFSLPVPAGCLCLPVASLHRRLGKRHWGTFFHNDCYKTLTATINAFGHSPTRGNKLCLWMVSNTYKKLIDSLFLKNFMTVYKDCYYKLLVFNRVAQMEITFVPYLSFLAFFFLVYMIWHESRCIQCKGGFTTCLVPHSLLEQGFSTLAFCHLGLHGSLLCV